MERANPALFKTKISRSGKIPTWNYLRKNQFKDFATAENINLGSSINNLNTGELGYINPIHEIIFQNNPSFIEKLNNTNENDDSDFIKMLPAGKRTVKSIIDNRNHFLWFDFIWILHLADINISFGSRPSKAGYIDVEKLQRFNPKLVKVNWQRLLKVLTFHQLNQKTTLNKENGFDPQVLRDKQLMLLGDVFDINYFHNPIKSSIESNSKTAFIDEIKINKDQLQKLGLRSKEKFFNFYFNDTHILYFDVINILRAAGLSLTYQITNKAQ